MALNYKKLILISSGLFSVLVIPFILFSNDTTVCCVDDCDEIEAFKFSYKDSSTNISNSTFINNSISMKGFSQKPEYKKLLERITRIPIENWGRDGKIAIYDFNKNEFNSDHFYNQKSYLNNTISVDNIWTSVDKILADNSNDNLVTIITDLSQGNSNKMRDKINEYLRNKKLAVGLISHKIPFSGKVSPKGNNLFYEFNGNRGIYIFTIGKYGDVKKYIENFLNTNDLGVTDSNCTIFSSNIVNKKITFSELNNITFEKNKVKDDNKESESNDDKEKKDTSKNTDTKKESNTSEYMSNYVVSFKDENSNPSSGTANMSTCQNEIKYEIDPNISIFESEVELFFSKPKYVPEFNNLKADVKMFTFLPKTDIESSKTSDIKVEDKKKTNLPATNKAKEAVKEQKEDSFVKKEITVSSKILDLEAFIPKGKNDDKSKGFFFDKTSKKSIKTYRENNDEKQILASKIKFKLDFKNRKTFPTGVYKLIIKLKPADEERGAGNRDKPLPTFITLTNYKNYSFDDDNQIDACIRKKSTSIDLCGRTFDLVSSVRNITGNIEKADVAELHYSFIVK